MIEILFCDNCDAETEHTTTRKINKERWQDESVDDDDLETYEVMRRANGDSTYTVTLLCHVCDSEFTFEDM